MESPQIGQLIGFGIAPTLLRYWCQRRVFAHGQMQEQVKMLEHHADFLPHVVGMRLLLAMRQGFVRLLAIQLDLSVAELIEFVDCPQQR